MATPLVLVVDDDRLQRTIADHVLRPMVEQRGWNFASAGGMEEALKLAAPAQEILVLTDHNMPGGSGIDLARGLAQKRARVIVLTASAGDGLRDAAAAAGVAEVVEKPFGLDAYEELATRLMIEWGAVHA